MLSKTIMQGRLTATPELKQTPNGISVTSFSIAVQRNYAPKGGERLVDFIDVVVFRNLAEHVCKYFQKGQEIIVDGSIETRTFTDKAGQNRKVWELKADRVYFAGKKPDAANKNEGAPAAAQVTEEFGEPVDNDGDLPF